MSVAGTQVKTECRWWRRVGISEAPGVGALRKVSPPRVVASAQLCVHLSAAIPQPSSFFLSVQPPQAPSRTARPPSALNLNAVVQCLAWEAGNISEYTHLQIWAGAVAHVRAVHMLH